MGFGARRLGWYARPLVLRPIPVLVLAAALACAACSASVPPPGPRAPPTSPGHAAATAPPDWERIREDDGITVWRRDVAGSPLVAFRGEGLVNAPLLRVASVIVDVERAHEWADRVVESRRLRRIGRCEAVTYTHARTPPVVADRDFVLHGRLTIEDGRRATIRFRSVQDAAMPPGDHVRGEVLDSSFVLTAEGEARTRVVAEIHADPKGALPAWLVNMVQRGWAVKTLRSLREQTARRDVVDLAWLREVFADARACR
jgi:hypothetical protein